MWKTIVLTGLLAGFLDGAAALLLFAARGAKQPLLLFQYIASAVYGNKAFAGGRKMIIAGVLLHLFIAMTFIIFYFLLFPFIKWLDIYPLMSAVLYGFLVWLMMNRMVIPLSRAQPRPFSWTMVFINVVILILTIGLPAAYFSRWFYSR